MPGEFKGGIDGGLRATFDVERIDGARKMNEKTIAFDRQEVKGIYGKDYGCYS